MHETRRLPGPLSSLGHRRFRLYFIGQSFSVLGSWVQQVAMSWLVYRLTGSTELLGLTAFLMLAPQLVVGPLMGAVFDRFDRRRLLILVQWILAGHATLLAVLTLSGLITPGLLVALSLVLGILNGTDTPLRQSLISGLLDDRAAIHNAVALNAMAFNAGRFIGPPVAGLLLTVMPEGVCFALNALSYVALVIGVALGGPGSVAPPKPAGSYFAALREGFAHAWADSTARTLLILVGVLNATASTYAVLAPIFAKEIYGGDARALGLLVGAAGAGAVLSTVSLAVVQGGTRAVTLMIGGSMGCALALIVFSQTTVLAVGLGAMVVLGFGISVTNVGTNAMLQTLAPDAVRGRMASLFTATRFGLDAFGGLAAGYLAAGLGGPGTILLEGILLTGALLFLAPMVLRLRRRLATP
jgi:MFS family permease